MICVFLRVIGVSFLVLFLYFFLCFLGVWLVFCWVFWVLFEFFGVCFLMFFFLVPHFPSREISIIEAEGDLLISDLIKIRENLQIYKSYYLITLRCLVAAC